MGQLSSLTSIESQHRDDDATTDNDPYAAKISTEEDMKIQELWIYPIKSCRGISLASSKMTQSLFL